MLADSMQNLQRSVARLSSGSKLAWIGEDPAGAGISIKFDAEVSRLQAHQTPLPFLKPRMVTSSKSQKPWIA